MPGGPATILGGLPVWAEVWFTRGDGYSTDDDAGVTELFWLKRDGTKGSPLPEHMYERLEAKDAYWECDVVDKVSDHLAYEQYLREQGERIVHHSTCRADYPEKPKGEAPQAVTETEGHVVCVDCGASVSVMVKLS